ncbi:MAG: hypothetical protein A2612_03645 [Candidatus Moranbacteria bacterium RIFOXYD1_FULL_44_12]|nr:MAG: hypothetical protein A2612_03645 [Candidatus Moranbacteria bacterium RIFOXYD1_FULL_44_12]
MNVYITGSRGFVASKVIEDLPKDWNLHIPEYDELDITNYEALQQYFADKKLDAIINFAAVTDVDGAEKERGDENGVCWQVNVNGAVNLANLAKEKQALMVQISTDFVFGGTSGSHDEASKPLDSMDSLSWYGWTKLVAEKRLAEVGGSLSVVRIAFPTGNFANPKDYLNKLKGGVEKGYGIFSDQQITLTYIPDLAKALTVILEQKKTGIYHVVTHPITTPFEVATALGVGEVKDGLLADFLKKEGIAKRPIKGGLLCDETQKTLGLTFASLNEVLATL